MAQLPTVGGDQDSWGDILNEYLLVSHTAGGRAKPLVVSYPYSASITPNVGTTEVANVGILTGDISIANPTGTPIDGQVLTFRFAQDSTGSRAIAWDTMYAFDTSVTVPNVLSAANAVWEMSFRWKASVSRWQIAGNSITQAASAGTGYASRTFSQTLTFDVPFKMETVQANNIAFVLGSNPVADVGARVTVVGDGTHACTFGTGFINANGQLFDNTQKNIIYFEYDGTEVLYSTVKISTPDVTAPSFVSAVIQNANKNKIVLAYSELLANIIPAAGDFTLNVSNVINSVTIAGSQVTLVCADNFSSTDVVTVTYTPGTNKIQDPSGNFALGLTARSVTNNVLVINTSLSVLATNQIPKSPLNPAALAFGASGSDTPMSISFWAKFISGSTPLLINLQRTSTTASSGIFMYGGGGGITTQIMGSGGLNGEAISIATHSALTLSVWHHIVLTYSGNKSSSGLKMYVDGSLITTDNSSVGATYNGQVAFSPDHQLSIAGGVVSGTDLPATGTLMDEVFFWNIELSPSQVLGVYNSGSTIDPSTLAFAANLVAGYKFNGDLTDIGPHGYNLTSVASPTFSTDAP